MPAGLHDNSFASYLLHNRYDNHAARMTMGILGNNHTTRKHLDLWLKKERQAQARKAAARVKEDTVHGQIKEVQRQLAQKKGKGQASKEGERKAILTVRRGEVSSRRSGRGALAESRGLLAERTREGRRGSYGAGGTFLRAPPSCRSSDEDGMTARTSASITRIRTSNISKYEIGGKIRTSEVSP
jgi:hypothetical protein